MFSADKNAVIHYTTDNSEPVSISAVYTDKIELKSSLTIKARAFKRNNASLSLSTFTFRLHKALRKKMDYITTYSQKYKGNNGCLTDGISALTDFKDGNWQGFFGDDAIMIIDMGKAQTLNSINISFLQDINSWIFSPLYVDIYAANENNEFNYFNTIMNNCPLDKEGTFINNFQTDLKQHTARYLKIHVKNIGLCPFWHIGKNEKAWWFIDDILVE